MGDDDGRSGQMGLNCPSSGTNTTLLSEKVVAGLAMNSGPMFKASHEGGECFYSSGWDPMVENFGTASMVAHGMFATPSYPVAPEIRGLSSTPHHMHYPSDPRVEMTPKLGTGSFPEMVSSFGMPGYGQNYSGMCPEKYASTKSMAIEEAHTGLVQSHEFCPRPEERAIGASPNGKRNRVSNPSSPSDPSKNAEGEPDRDLSGETSEPKESDEKKRRIGKETRVCSQGGETTKEDYIHVRARRGQATNSHSLAERVRREKISQRMRLLQEIVPGCNKITGKAVMLDEIINYVQSLQQQVEFLSMKLATVNPELNFDLDRILSKDILHLRGGGGPVLGFNPVTSSSHPYPAGIHQGGVPGISNTSAYTSLPQGMWEGEMQGLFHMGFDSNPSAANLNGSSKPEAP